ncbi:unnamed protein product [Symbiodinium sp. CCMP2456]|nr:unnamed protein product [Symbiodinium sp. CCMP2456]
MASSQRSQCPAFIKHWLESQNPVVLPPLLSQGRSVAWAVCFCNKDPAQQSLPVVRTKGWVCFFRPHARRLFEQCSRAPPKKAVDADHLAAFAAFDDLLKPPEEVEPAVRPPEGAQGSWPPPGGPGGGFAGDLLGDGPSTSVARIPAQAQSETAEAPAQSNGQIGSGPAMFFIGDDPQEETPDFAAVAAAGGGGAAHQE